MRFSIRCSVKNRRKKGPWVWFVSFKMQSHVFFTSVLLLLSSISSFSSFVLFLLYSFLFHLEQICWFLILPPPPLRILTLWRCVGFKILIRLKWAVFHLLFTCFLFRSKHVSMVSPPFSCCTSTPPNVDVERKNDFYVYVRKDTFEVDCSSSMRDSSSFFFLFGFVLFVFRNSDLLMDSFCMIPFLFPIQPRKKSLITKLVKAGRSLKIASPEKKNPLSIEPF